MKNFIITLVIIFLILLICIAVCDLILVIRKLKDGRINRKTK